MPNRAAAEKIILDGVSLIDVTGKSLKVLKSFFTQMDDKAFHAYMTAVKEGREYISIIMDNLNGNKITTVNNIAVAKKLGCKLYQRVWTTDQATGVTYLTNEEYLVVHLPVRRQIQTLLHKISIPEDNKHVDELTDQPTGASKGSSISQPELLVMLSGGSVAAIEEFMRFRGGDLKLMAAMDQSIHETGGASMEALGANATSRVKSTVVLSTFLTAMHIRNNF